MTCVVNNTLINISGYVLPLWPDCLQGRDNPNQQETMSVFKWECPTVMATICICPENLMEESVLSRLAHVQANHRELALMQRCGVEGRRCGGPFKPG